MGEVPRSGGGIVFVGEEPDGIAHRTGADMIDADARVDRIGKRGGGEIGAARFHHQPDHCAAMNIERACLDQIFVHRRVEPEIIDRIVDVAVDVVVRPARADLRECRVLRADGAGRAAHAVTMKALTPSAWRMVTLRPIGSCAGSISAAMAASLAASSGRATMRPFSVRAITTARAGRPLA